MPRGKLWNHKGGARQFTPIEELQREQEVECLTGNNKNILMRASSGSDYQCEDESEKSKKFGGAVQGLIEISNPNWPATKNEKFKNGEGEKLSAKQRLEKRRTNQKSASEANADLARLALVRKQREEAAELRLAAALAKQQLVTPIASKTDVNLKKKPTKPTGNGAGAGAKTKAGIGSNELSKKKPHNNNKTNEM